MKHSKLGLTRFVVAVCLLAFLRVSCAQNVVTYYHTDITGSPIAATNSSGVVIWREEFTPYGEKALQEVASESNRLWFTGHHHDDQTGLTYAGARHYDPMIGRFMAVDPMGSDPANQFSFSRYVYANNNPYGYVDPDGENALTAGLLLLAFAGALYIGGCQAAGSCPKFGQTLGEIVNSDSNPLRFRGRMSMGPGDIGKGGSSSDDLSGIAGTPPDPDEDGGGSSPGGRKVVSRIKESPKLVREAETAGRSVQGSLNRLVSELSRGNMNPGIGTRPIGRGLSEARARDGARVYFRAGRDGQIEILGKSSKSNQDVVIKEVLRVFGK